MVVMYWQSLQITPGDIIRLLKTNAALLCMGEDKSRKSNKQKQKVWEDAIKAVTVVYDKKTLADMLE